MLIAPKRLKIRTSNLAGVFPGIVPTLTPDKSFRCGHGQGHVTTTTVPCKLQQWVRYRVPKNVFL